MTRFEYLLFKNHWANFNQTWRKVSLGEGIQVCWNIRPSPFSRGNNYEIIAKTHWRNLKIFFCRTTGPISTKRGIKHPWVKGFTNKDHSIIKQEMIGFLLSKSMLWYTVIIAVNKCVYWFKLGFSGERYGSWASCFNFTGARRSCQGQQEFAPTRGTGCDVLYPWGLQWLQGHACFFF
mgnify:CR=1 FL=1